mmetsp:Transcript_22487/g.28380  ORF Transcript_22487/g.28380 Transcript_22487/m.28380 type:complete len:254 (+) Transcript_22487:356-1117(+)
MQIVMMEEVQVVAVAVGVVVTAMEEVLVAAVAAGAVITAGIAVVVVVMEMVMVVTITMAEVVTEMEIVATITMVEVVTEMVMVVMEMGTVEMEMVVTMTTAVAIITTITTVTITEVVEVMTMATTTAVMILQIAAAAPVGGTTMFPTITMEVNITVTIQATQQDLRSKWSHGPLLLLVWRWFLLELQWLHTRVPRIQHLQMMVQCPLEERQVAGAVGDMPYEELSRNVCPCSRLPTIRNLGGREVGVVEVSRC